MKPFITLHDAETGQTIEREMSNAEYEALLASGWSEGEPEE